MAKTVIHELAKRNDELLSMVHLFNTSPAKYMHTSWMKGFLPEYKIVEIQKSYRAERIISKRILNEINHQYIYDFEKQSRRLVLLEMSTLEKLFFFTGISLLSKKISRIIIRSQMLEVKENLGNDIYDFAIKKAPVLVDGLNIKLDEKQGNKDYKTYAMVCGVKCFEKCLSLEPEPLLKRFQLKFPKGKAWNFSRKVTGTEKEQAWLIIKKVLLKEVAPEWNQIFS